LSSFNLRTLSSEPCFFLLGFGLGCLLSALLFLLLYLARLNLLLKGLEAGGGCLALILELGFLTSSVIPRR
jgi:hypothetical protein